MKIDEVPEMLWKYLPQNHVSAIGIGIGDENIPSVIVYLLKKLPKKYMIKEVDGYKVIYKIAGKVVPL